MQQQQQKHKGQRNKRQRHQAAIRKGVAFADGAGATRVDRLANLIGDIEQNLRDAGDRNVSPAEVARRLSKRLDDSSDFKGLVVPGTKALRIESLDGPALFLVAYGMVVWFRNKKKGRKVEDRDIDEAADDAEKDGTPDINDLDEDD